MPRDAGRYNSENTQPNWVNRAKTKEEIRKLGSDIPPWIVDIANDIILAVIGSLISSNLPGFALCAKTVGVARSLALFSGFKL